MGVGRLRAVSFFSFESQYIESTLEKGSGGTPHNGLYGEAPPEGGTFFRFQVYERVGIFFINLDYHLLFVLLIGGGGNGESPWKYVRNTDIITSMLWS